LQVDSSNFVLRYITISSALVTTFAGRSTSHSSSVDGVGTASTFNQPRGVTLNQAGTLALIVSDSMRAVSVRVFSLHDVVTTELQTDASRVRMIVMSSRLVSTLAGSGYYPGGVSADGIGSGAFFSSIYGISMNAAGTVALVVCGA
jgi:hypothetical protein